MIEIRTGDINAFFAAPFQIYGARTPYVSPMLSDLKRFLSAEKNPLFETAADFAYFTAHQDGAVCGRITAHVHRASNARFGLDRAYFGYFDCVDDEHVAAALLARAEDWARARGFQEILGNFNLTAMQQIGIMTDGFENAPYTDQIWGPPYLPRLLERRGYSPCFPMTTFEIDVRTVAIDGLLASAQMRALFDDGFRFSPIRRATLDRRLEDSRLILNESFADNPMFVPVSRAEFEFQAKEMKWIMDPRISALAEKDDTPAGAVIAIPDVNPMLKAMGSRLGFSAPWHLIKNRLQRRRAVIIFQGVKPEHRGRGLNPLLLAHVLGEMRRAGYETAGGTWIADVNAASLRQAEKAGARPLHRLHLFGKSL
ncbi:GNAT family N-acetyltransferase [Ensifer adhaerens]|uniref:GNAT family N-acetyltransferase n=1 Tax=Ensifer adhaerens TaxID=106592 RepID=UPI001CC0C842|nr:GNAT family N-acetyltransferase [Ensifer adhaerens]MBZ7926439.1 GNAT family N-acetyltransferase [Ensifer adhaerens]UAX97208.1 GNAT family N-acetyltransferase [Ensifer adhaerens]